MAATPQLAHSHSAAVRLTHWLNAAAFFALLTSGIAILISHPRLYWGETGSLQTPSFMDLPLPMILANQNGWARSLHFLAAWAALAIGFFYYLHGLRSRHFARHLAAGNALYSAAQRTAYAAVVFVLFPLMFWTGLAMSPAVTSVVPALVNTLGGQQSARTIHFFAASALTLFLVGHVVMVVLSGFFANLRAITLGAPTPDQP